ncbi:MAG: hypothetical protein ACJAQT_000240 [Akkermansiaceae bacterium]
MAVFTFAEFEADPGIDNFLANADGGIARGKRGGLFEGLGAAGSAGVAFDDDGSATEFGERGFIGDSFDEDEVAAAVLIARIEEAIFERFFVREEKEAFRVHVEAAEREAFWREAEFLESALSFVAGVGIELAENSVGFVEGDEHGGSASYEGS